jgi:hypothetical protein
MHKTADEDENHSKTYSDNRNGGRIAGRHGSGGILGKHPGG